MKSPPPAAALAFVRRRFVIVKRDRLAAELIRQVVGVCVAEAETICCHSALSALAALRASPAQLGLFGLTLPDMDGVDLISVALAERLVFRVLAISTRQDEVVRARLRLGRIDGFFNPACDDPSRLAEAIGRIIQGGVYFSPPPEQYGAPSGDTKVTLDQSLSPHELKVFALIGDGSDDEEVAARLGLSVHTVHGHRQRIMRKLAVRTRTELMRAAIQRGVVRITPDRIFRPGFEHSELRGGGGLLIHEAQRGMSPPPMPTPRDSGDA